MGSPRIQANASFQSRGIQGAFRWTPSLKVAWIIYFWGLSLNACFANPPETKITTQPKPFSPSDDDYFQSDNFPDDELGHAYGSHSPFRPGVLIPPGPLVPPTLPVPDYPTAFSAIRAHPRTRGCPDDACIVIFENILTPFTNDFDRNSGIFHCRLPGLYFFTFSGISPAHTSFRLALFHNNHEVISTYGLANGFGTAGNSIILQLELGNKVCLKLMEGELYESDAQFRAYTTFTGFLLQSHARYREPTGNGFNIFYGENQRPLPDTEYLPAEYGPRNSDIGNNTLVRENRLSNSTK